MGVISGIVVYIIVWWTVLFTVLPWGVRQPEQQEPGIVGAPVNPNLKQKFLITTVIAALVWGLIAWLMHIRIFDFREWAANAQLGW